jgi:hypothetical protein
MKKLFVLIVSMMYLGAFAQDSKVINDANVVTRSVSGSFTGISVSSGIDVYLTQGNEETVAVSASEQKHLDRLITEVVNGTLKIYYDNKGITWKSSGKANLKAYVSFKTLEKLHVSAGSDVSVNGSIKADKLDLQVSSGAEFTGAINAKELVAEVNSGADAKLSGSADKLTVSVSSGASLKGFDFAADYCDASVSSGGDVHLTINKELVAKASSGGDIQYKGAGLISDIKTSSGGGVKMKQFLTLLVTVFAVLGLQAQNEIVVDPNASIRELRGNFDAIKVSGGIDLYLSQSDNGAIAVSASNEDYKNGIKTIIESGTLRIFYEGDKGWNKKDKKLRVYVSFTGLKKIDASGACDVIVAGSLVSTNLVLHMSGACDFSGMVKVNTLDINLSGASDAKISGTANTVNIKSSGASDVKAFELVADICNANISGASDVHITVNSELTAAASGASDIKYKGNGVVKEKHASGSSSITKEE